MAKNKNIQEIYNHLADLDRKHTLALNEQVRESIEDYTRTYANYYIDYTQMSEGSASGFFAHLGAFKYRLLSLNHLGIVHFY